MKITKQQLKQIIKEEISKISENLPIPGEGPLSGEGDHLDLGGHPRDFWALREDVDDIIERLKRGEDVNEIITRLTRLRDIIQNMSGVFEE